MTSRFFGQMLQVVITVIAISTVSTSQSNFRVQTTQQWIEFMKSEDGLCARGKAFRESSSKSPAECGLLCLAEPGCEAFEIVKGTCYLMDVELDLKELTQEEGCDHYSIQVGEILVPLLGIFRRVPHHSATLVPFYFPGGTLVPFYFPGGALPFRFLIGNS
jgi:hypothetical protein